MPTDKFVVKLGGYFTSTSEGREMWVVNLIADKRETRTVHYLVRKPVVC
jgi:hypothetical protein